MTDNQTEDVVNHPSHYTAYKGLEVIDLTEQMNFNKGNAVKYIARAGLKDPSKEIEDLEKAKWYVQREIDRLQPKVEEDPIARLFSAESSEPVSLIAGQKRWTNPNGDVVINNVDSSQALLMLNGKVAGVINNELVCPDCEFELVQDLSDIGKFDCPVGHGYMRFTKRGVKPPPSFVPGSAPFVKYHDPRPTCVACDLEMTPEKKQEHDDKTMYACPDGHGRLLLPNAS